MPLHFIVIYCLPLDV